MTFAAALPFLAAGLVGGAAITALKKPAAAPRMAVPLPTATARTSSVVSDALSRRTGSAANRRTGALGAESSAAPKKTLMGT
jgi:hypothetical protein